VGTVLAWVTGIAPGATPPMPASLHLPVPVLGDLLAGLQGPHLLASFSVTLPMGLFNVVGSLQNIESADAAGDPYPTAPSLAMNGMGSIAAACFGSCFPTTIYIGHPGWKAMGARSGYSVLTPSSPPSCASPAPCRTSPGACRSTPAWRSSSGSAS